MIRGDVMKSEVDSILLYTDPKETPAVYALRVGDGLEVAEFHPSLWKLTVYHDLGASRSVTLGHAEVYLLEYFITHPGEMKSRQELMEHAWGNRIVSQGSLSQAISTLRAVLGDDKKREVIITVPRRGYQFNGNAVLDHQEWLTRKQRILGVNDNQTEENKTPFIGLSAERSARWQLPIFWSSSVALSLLLLTGLTLKSFYTLFPPYASEQLNTARTQLTLLAKNEEELDSTRNLLQPVFKRIEVLGGGRALINRVNNYLEFNCLRLDGTLHTILVHVARVHDLDDIYLQRCLK
jgi:DNA-binding winged helix-turn-helix (wHTH) protein